MQKLKLSLLLAWKLTLWLISTYFNLISLQAVLKIIKHSRESLPTLVTGQLLGLDMDGTLEVTNCFPFLTDMNDEEGTNDGERVAGFG